MDGAFSCFRGVRDSHRETGHEETQQQQVRGECGRSRGECGRAMPRRRVEEGTVNEEYDHYHYHYNSDDEEKEQQEEEEEDEEESAFILQDCAPQHCFGSPESSSPCLASQPCRKSRSLPSNPQISAAIRHHHNHCRVNRPHIPEQPPNTESGNFRWDIALLRALRKDPISNNMRETGKRRQPGRVDMTFIPKKGDLIIHHDRKQWRRVLEFYDPSFQRLHDGDILIRIRIDSYSCLGILLMKGTGYMYHRGYWMFLGTDSDQISQCLQGR